MNGMNRRRFLAITAASTALVGATSFNNGIIEKIEWQGVAFGSDVSVTLYGDPTEGKQVLDEIKQTIRRLENKFSLYDSNSEISQLNLKGFLSPSSTEFSELVRWSNLVYESSNRLFDPTVQPLFMKYSGVRSEIEGNKSLTVGWDKVRHTENEIYFGEPGMAITFNGIAQGYATDVVKSLLKSRGFDQTLVNIGEFAAGKKLARIGLADDTGKVFEVQNIIDQAIATSSPGSLSFENGGTHIIRPNGGLKSASWKTVSVIAELAVLADGFSTALCLTENTDLAVDLKSRGLVQRVILQDIDNVVTII